MAREATIRGPSDARAATRTALLERERELATIDAALGAARSYDARGCLLFIEGHAGIGKSGLVASARELAADSGMTVLNGRGRDLERGHSFGVVRQLFEPLLAQSTPVEREDLLSGGAALSNPLFEHHEGSAAPPDEQVFSLLHGLYWLVSNLSERAPVLIAADDVHWTDRSSLRFLLYLAQRLAELPVVVVTAARPGEPGAPDDLMRQLRTHRVTRTLQPAPLSRTGVEALVWRRWSVAEHRFVDACLAVTEGNPYLLSELLADLGDRGVAPTDANAGAVGALAPEAVLDAALVRLARLPTGSGALARGTAVLGDDATLARAAALAELDVELAAPIADALAAAEILRPCEPLAFVHPLLHSAIYLDLPAAERARMHRRAAKLLDGAGAPAETVAAHLLVATAVGDRWTVDRLRAAAARSLAQGGAESAAAYLMRALDEPPPAEARVQLLVDLGEAEALAGRAGAIDRLNEALGLVDDPRRRAEVFQRLGWMLQQTGDLRGAVDSFSRGLQELQSLPPDELSESLQVKNLQIAHLGAAMLEPSEAHEAHARVAGIIAKAESELSSNERGLLSVAGLGGLFRGDSHESVIRLMRKVWAGGALLEAEGSNSPTVWHVVGSLSWSDAVDESESMIESTLEAARREGSIVTQALGLYGRSWPRYWRGDLAGAAADAQAAVNAWSGEFSMYLPVAAYWLSLALVELGQVDAAEEAVDYPDAYERWRDTNMYGPLLSGQGVVQMVRGDHASAVATFEAAGETVIGTMVTNPAVLPWRSWLALARLGSGDVEGAREAAREELELARRFGAPRPIGVALRVAGLTEGGEGGTLLIEESVELLRHSFAKLDLARSLVELGGALRRDRHRAAAREPLHEGLKMARSFGAVLLAQRAEDELIAAGGRPRKTGMVGVASLTPGERRVAELAVSGMTNREIAQALFVTVKAVQFHLGNTYRKLGVHDREALAAALAAARCQD